VRADPLLGPVFNPVVEDWDAHKVLTSFWATVVLRAGHYRGNPLAKHQPLPIGSEHFQRWLALWRETTRELLDPESAALVPATPNGSATECGSDSGSRATGAAANRAFRSGRIESRSRSLRAG